MKRADRLEQVGSVLIYCHHTLVVGVGIFGMTEAPSPAVALVIGGRIAATIWSLMFTVFGLAALGCRFANRRKWLDTTRSEAIAIALIGVAASFFAVLVGYSSFVSGTPGSIQTGLLILSASAFLPGVAAISLALTRREMLARRHEQTIQILDQVAEKIRRPEEE